jgi:catechol 2,3-dioxygenase-like lactoylglutathione lyase family enzyme
MRVGVSTNIDIREDLDMSRVQLAINVTDIDEGIAFYSRMFGTAPAKVRPGYANFAIADPPLKLVLFEADEGATLNHLGVEVESAAEVTAAEARLRDEGLETTGVDETVCCYAEKTETWVTDPDGARWEWYVKRADVELAEFGVADDGTCACT